MGSPWVVGVGSPGILLLNAWGDAVRRVFDATPYLVGSASTGKQWRDVDVRLILEDAEWEHWFGRFERPLHTNARWAGVCLAFSLWGQKVTDLPIDFQVEQASDAEAQDYGGNRVPLGIYPYPQPRQSRAKCNCYTVEERLLCGDSCLDLSPTTQPPSSESGMEP